MLGERFRYWTGKRLLSRAEMVLAVSQSAADDAMRFARVRSDRIRVVPEGVDGAFHPLGAQARARVGARYGLEKPYLLFIGALDARKDPRGLLRAWRRARAEGADVELVLAGGLGPQAPRRMTGARQLGYLGVDELAELLSAASCLVFSSRYEGFGLPILEAMACGCPVVAYANSSIPEVVGDAALLVPDGHAGQLGKAAARVVLDPGLAATLSKAGLRRAKRFDWGRTARATIAAYRALLR
jgi:glycosyltransferase involved in cell wall biosynthesis